MPYIASGAEGYENTKVDNGQCVRYVQVAAKAPATTQWVQGVKVRGAQNISKGTAIATFVDGQYPNNSTGNHAAIYLSQDADGILVLDQWVSQGKVKKRKIRFKGGSGSPSNDGDTFYVVE